MKNVVVLALEGCPMSSVALPVDILNAAGVLYNRIAGIPENPVFSVRVAAMEEGPIRCMKSVELMPDLWLDEWDDPDFVIIPGLDRPVGLRKRFAPLLDKLVSLHERGVVLASICTGAFLLGETGLLSGKAATTHWGMQKLFSDRYPDVVLQAGKTVVDQETLLTAGGTTAGADLSLYIIRKYCGNEVADQCAKVLLLDPYRSSQSPYEALAVPVDHGDAEVLKAQEWIDRNFSREIGVDDLAQKVCLSRRTFERRFKKATGDSPLRYLQRLRIEKAKQLLESGDFTFETITGEVGYEDPSTFRRLFQKKTGLPPGLYRQRFRVKGAFTPSGPAV